MELYHEITRKYFKDCQIVDDLVTERCHSTHDRDDRSTERTVCSKVFGGGVRAAEVGCTSPPRARSQTLHGEVHNGGRVGLHDYRPLGAPRLL